MEQLASDAENDTIRHHRLEQRPLRRSRAKVHVPDLHRDGARRHAVAAQIERRARDQREELTREIAILPKVFGKRLITADALRFAACFDLGVIGAVILGLGIMGAARTGSRAASQRVAPSASRVSTRSRLPVSSSVRRSRPIEMPLSVLPRIIPRSGIAYCGSHHGSTRTMAATATP